MGTNYYAKRILTEGEAKYSENLLKEQKYEELKDFLHDKTDLIHIGKDSYGWKFLFNYNNFKYYYSTKASINEFLSSHEIVDEYGREIALEEFLELIKRKESGIDNTEYYTREGKKYKFLELMTYPKELECYNPKNGEFYSDGLRFATCTDFS